MGHNKPNGHGTLDQRIAAVLASDVVDKAALTLLLEEAEAALVEAQRTIEVESANALDISNSDPDASDEQVRKAERTSARLTIAIPKLRDRIRSIELYEFRQAWHARADVKGAERDVLAEELVELYEPFLAHITDLYARIDKNAAAIADLHRQAPAGENRRLLDAELVARGIDRYDAAHPRLRDNLKLPEFIKSSTIAFPPNPMDQWNRYAAQSHAAMAKRMAEKGALATGDNWHAGRDLQIGQAEVEFAKRDAELKAAETKSKAEYEAKLQEAERRRQIGGTP
jgi:hypothetical protein